jgi:hypothetical protein
MRFSRWRRAARLARALPTILLLPQKRVPEAFEGLQRIEPEGAGARPPVEISQEETSNSARAGLSEHKGLTNGSGVKAEATVGAPRAPPRRSVFGRLTRSGARDGPGFVPASGLATDGGLTNGSGRVNGGRTNGGRVNGGRVNGGRVNGGRVNGGRVNGGRVNGGRVNGGRVNGGRVNGGLVNGNGLLMSERIRERRRKSTRRTAIFLAALIFAVAFFGPLFFNGILGAPPIVIDGAFSDWASVPVVPDSALDQPNNDDINLVAFTALQSDRDLYFYAQVAQRGRPFLGSATPPLAESFRLLIDRDRSAATGFAAFGLGIDFVVELTGFDGALRASSLHAFPSTSPDHTDTSFFSTAGAVRAIARGNQIEGSVPLIDLGISSPTALPFLLFLAQDSAGNEDLGDAVFSSLPGVLELTQSPTTLGTLPTDRDVLLLEVEGTALHQNITLASLLVTVEGDNGAGVALAYATFAGRNQSLNTTASAGETVRVNLTEGGPLVFSLFSPPTTISIFGRATGAPGVAVVRLFLNGSESALTASAPPSTSGHASIFPPFSFERAYVGAAPASIRIDGAFADWGPVRPFDADGNDDLLLGAPPSPTNLSATPAVLDQNIDIHETRADSNSGSGELSFYASVDGSIMAGKLLDLPLYPRPTAPATGGAGSGAPPGRTTDGDLATIYVDSDLNPLTGWAALPGIGVDAIIQISGKGGAYGRTPRTTETSLALFDAGTGAFNRTVRPIPVGYSSSKLETQLPAADICPGSCRTVRYAFFMQDLSGALDFAGPHGSNFRGDGEALYFDENSPRNRNAYQGDRAAPALSISLTSPSSNDRDAAVSSFLVELRGVLPSDITRVALYYDHAVPGALDANDLAQGPIAEGRVEAGGFAHLVPAAPLALPPGSRLDALLTIDVSPTASTPAFLNATIGRVLGVLATGIPDVRYSYPPVGTPIRILPSGEGSRGENDMVVNEVNFVAGFVEIWDTTGSVTNLTSPAVMGITVYRTANNGGSVRTVDIRVFSGSTNAEGFAAINYSVPLTTATRKYYVGLWCSNCTAGRDASGANNSTYIDFLQMPRSTSNGSWGRFPDGNVTARNTTNDTRADNNKLPAPGDNGTDPSGQNNLVINEVNFVANWVEVFATHGTTTNLTRPATIGIEVYYSNNAGTTFTSVAIRVFSGNTTSEGFAALNVTAPYSTATRRYHVGLWCSNCTGGQDFRGRNNNSYLDDVELPRNTTVGAWGRYPDANDSFMNTTNSTRADNNTIPEFQDLVLPTSGVALAALALRRRRPQGEANGPTFDAAAGHP